ncbi:MAG: AbrB/MazE/SpoVT family DNA-binding domain-containing protein [Candidatus Micrarchaeia archaeon]|jgi:hypothetical protein
MNPAKVSLRGFILDGYKCVCGEETFNPYDVERVRLALHENVKARKVANSLVVTLPKGFANLAKISEGDSLKWTVAKDRLILEKSAA